MYDAFRTSMYSIQSRMESLLPHLLQPIQSLTDYQWYKCRKYLFFISLSTCEWSVTDIKYVNRWESFSSNKVIGDVRPNNSRKSKGNVIQRTTSIVPAPCSTKLVKLLISSRRLCTVSFARCSFSWAASTIFHAFSISFRSELMALLSSSLNFMADWTLAELVTNSEFNSRHFCIKRFSLSWDFNSARWSFSYSLRNLSKLRSPATSSFNTV